MPETDNLGCTIYVESDQPREALASLLRTLQGKAVAGPGGVVISAPFGEVEVRKNPDAERARANAFPDGFLHFRYCLELYPSPATTREDLVVLTGQLLTSLWDAALPAVAACDYEAELPAGGGYKDRSKPWPSAAASLGSGPAGTRMANGAVPGWIADPQPGGSE